MKTRKEIEKGCDKDLGWCSDLLLRNACCGEETELGVEYCPTCQSLLQQSKEFIEMIEGVIFNYKVKTNAKLPTIKILNEIEEEFKSSIIGSEEKK